MSHDPHAVSTPPSPVDISGRSDRENLFILVLVVTGLLYLLVRAAELKEMKPSRLPPSGQIRTFR